MNAYLANKGTIMQKRKFEYDGKTFAIFGAATWMVAPIKAYKKIPNGFIVIESQNLAFLLASDDPMKYNALGSYSPKGALIPTFFTGDNGKLLGERMVRELNKVF